VIPKMILKAALKVILKMTTGIGLIVPWFRERLLAVLFYPVSVTQRIKKCKCTGGLQDGGAQKFGVPIAQLY